MPLFKIGDMVVLPPDDKEEFWSPVRVMHIINPDSQQATLSCQDKYGDWIYVSPDDVFHYSPVFTKNEHSEIVNTEFVTNKEGGVKADGGKVRPTILLQDLNKATNSVVRVLEYGARKYSRANYAKVENERYLDAIGRHYMAYLSGEQNDPETGESHMAHIACCALFLIQKED